MVMKKRTLSMEVLSALDAEMLRAVAVEFPFVCSLDQGSELAWL